MSVMEFDSRIAGIPCTIRVTHMFVQPPHRGSPHTCDSDMDFYGYTECEFDVLDRKGYPADWLAKKMTDEDERRITREAEERWSD
jgi:hypothetical protein